MNVYCCKNNINFGGGLILVAANTIEEAFLIATKDTKISYLFDWHNENGWIEPDDNINHVTSDTYPFDKWFKIDNLIANVNKPQVIIEDHYTE